MLIRIIQPRVAAVWERMRQVLWPSAEGEHVAEIASFFLEKEKMAQETFIAFDDFGKPLGFAELSLRNYVEGCATDRVAYLEGWYVEPHARRQGVGAALVKAAEEWGRAQGCSEFASDTEWHNEVSAAAHRALGFLETDRIICFMKKL